MIIDRIHGPNDIKKLSPDEIQMLPREIRDYMIHNLSVSGGHVASNLGVVELTIALHLVLDLPHDSIIWDVGHQCYTHKILTGRADRFQTLRSEGGLSGFPDPDESQCDPFVTGHASSALSLGLGMCRARELTGDDGKVVAVVGDGALTGGLAFEALNNVGELGRNFLIILNDNNMSISENVGGLSKHLSTLRTSEGYLGLKAGVKNSLERLPGGDRIVESIHRTKSGIKQLVIPGMVFENMGVMYQGPVDGHDIDAMREMFTRAFSFDGPVIVHVLTEKGRGYEPARRHPARFHGIGPFDEETGAVEKPKASSYTDVFSTVMSKLGEREPSMVALTAAMKDGTGLARFASEYPDRFFDVGIAEEHGVTFAAALAQQGLVPVVAIYSTFLQRAYDEIMTDVCLTGKHVVFAVDRAGIVGRDGKTHQGLFDIAYLSGMPGMTLMAPKNKWELSDMLRFAVCSMDAPVAIRYPRGEAWDGFHEKRSPIEYGKGEMLLSSDPGSHGPRVLLFALGTMVKTASEIIDLMTDEIRADLFNARFAAPFDREFLEEHAGEYDIVVTLEEGAATGGLGEHVGAFLSDIGFKGRFVRINAGDGFVTHGDPGYLKKELGLDAQSIADVLRSL